MGCLADGGRDASSSMNEMDVSIDQVQSNANETARLSEEVSQDAERGAEAILKTIAEINRIKETSQEGVAVISNLGSRIEAIGQIVNVIDDVAEQTNLLALNAAIIAAQAGEHGKGFAVVADEIKDLAERAGASTKEITDLIKTIQTESKNAITAVERGATMVDRGVEVSNEAERALKKILGKLEKEHEHGAGDRTCNGGTGQGLEAGDRRDGSDCGDRSTDCRRDGRASARVGTDHEVGRTDANDHRTRRAQLAGASARRAADISSDGVDCGVGQPAGMNPTGPRRDPASK